MSYYIRFTNDINRDINRGYSKNMHGKRLNGLCAWSVMGDYNPHSDESIIAAAEKTAALIKKNGYGGYETGNRYAVVEGSMTGGYSNDGTLIKVERLLGEFSM